MGRRRRSRPPPPPSAITVAHFNLLRAYGRNHLAKKVSKREAEKLWEIACNTAQIAYVPREQVEEEWKRYIAGQSNYSAIAINGDIDPKFVTLGITYVGVHHSSHTLRTMALLKRVLLIWARCFPNRSAFLSAAERLCQNIAKKIFPDEGPP